jgi:CheY-like chemotaxis protein
MDKAFDLIIVDFEIRGIDSLELIESIEYIDPGIPIILLLQQQHKAVRGLAHHLNANPILQPFKPLTFLRLVDTLLHQQLERYRDLSETLSTILENLAKQITTTVSFLIDSSGQVLMSSGDVEPELLETLALLAAGQFKPNSPIPAETKNSQRYLAPTPHQKDHDLHILQITENLFLVLVLAITASPTNWEPAEVIKRIRQAFFDNAFQTSSTPSDSAAEVLLTDHTLFQNMVIPLKLALAPRESPASPDSYADEVTINWQIISHNSEVLNRLQDILAQ